MAEIAVAVGKNCLSMVRGKGRDKEIIVFEGQEEIQELFKQLGNIVFYYSEKD